MHMHRVRRTNHPPDLQRRVPQCSILRVLWDGQQWMNKNMMQPVSHLQGFSHFGNAKPWQFFDTVAKQCVHFLRIVIKQSSPLLLMLQVTSYELCSDQQPLLCSGVGKHLDIRQTRLQHCVYWVVDRMIFTNTMRHPLYVPKIIQNPSTSLPLPETE